MDGRKPKGSQTSTKLLFDTLKKDLEGVNWPAIAANQSAQIEFLQDLMSSCGELKAKLGIAVAAEKDWLVAERKNYELAHGASDSTGPEIQEDETDFLKHMLNLKSALEKAEKIIDDAKKQTTEAADFLAKLDLLPVHNFENNDDNSLAKLTRRFV